LSGVRALRPVPRAEDRGHVLDADAAEVQVQPGGPPDARAWDRHRAASSPGQTLPDAALATGFPRADVENDFARARRHQILAALAHRLRRQPPGTDRILPLDEVVGALGWRGERYLGQQTIRLDTIVGVDSRRDFDRRFRSTTNRVRPRWEQLALAARRGAAIPPIEAYRVGDQHFVSDGHHRVSIAAATGQQAIDAYVTEVLTTRAPRGTGPGAA
jgi:hypothetical protein